jgi:uncharacterized protein YraI
LEIDPMTNKSILLGGVTLALAGFCGGAQAQSTFTATTVNMHAGPGGGYPVVTVLGPSLPLTVLGCTTRYDWCDVSAGGARGWVSSSLINYVSPDGATSALRDWAPARVEVVPFAVDRYWGEHYRDRPWYGERRRWAQEDRGRDRREQRREPESRLQPQPQTVPPPGAPGAPPFMQHNP